MIKRIQTFTTIQKGKKPIPVSAYQVKSFDQYRGEVKAKKLAEQMYVDNLLNQLVEAKAGVKDNDLMAEIKDLKEQLKPLTKALTHKITDVKKVDKKQAIIEKFRASQLLK